MSTLPLSEFLGGYQRGIEVAVAAASADELLGVREAFRRFFHDGLGRPVPVAVVPQGVDHPLHGLAGSDREAIEAARHVAGVLRGRLGAHYQFYVGLEVAVSPVELKDGVRFMLRSWASVLGPPGEACGASGSLQLPARLVGERSTDPSVAMPGTRRGGGLFASLTGGLETRRRAVALAVVEALSSLFHGILESGPAPAP